MSGDHDGHIAGIHDGMKLEEVRGVDEVSYIAVFRVYSSRMFCAM